MAAASGDQGHSKARMDVINTGDFLRRGLRAAPLLIRRIIVVHHQFLHLYEALDDRYYPEVHFWNLEQTEWAVAM